MSVRLLMEKPATYITPNVPTSDKGTATAGISVADTLRKNTKITATTSAIANNSSISTSFTEARMVTVRSLSTRTSTDAGKLACNCGSSALTRFTVSMTLAPGWRCTFKITPGDRSAQAAKRRFSASSTILATSRKRTGLPALKAMTRLV